jgi:hypothetical protein|tara:strand:+ start:3860 stop:4213 length:354 start_codon:yes stop_codon:yes gene_type:complete
MQVNIKKSAKTVECTITLEKATPILKYQYSGRTIGYEDLHMIKVFQVKEMVQAKLSKNEVVGGVIEGPKRIDNQESDQTATWIFEIKKTNNLTNTNNSDKVETGKQVSKARKTKTKK